MKIAVTKEEAEEIIISLIFTDFIKSENRITNKNCSLLKNILEQVYNLGFTDLVTKKEDVVFVTDALFEKAVFLVAIQNGERTDNIPTVIEEATEEYRKQLLN